MFKLGLQRQKGSLAALTASACKQKAKKIKQFIVGTDKAIVAKTICPDCPGRVRYEATWWPAQCDQGVELYPGDEVRVIGIRNITLLVEPLLNGSLPNGADPPAAAIGYWLDS